MKKDFRLLRNYALGIRGKMYFGSTILIASTLCSLLSSYLEKNIIDSVFTELNIEILFRNLTIYGMLAIGAFIFGLIGPYILLKVNTSFRLKLYKKLLTVIYKIPTEIMLAGRVGNYYNYFLNDVPQASMIYIYLIPEILLQFFTCVLLIVFLGKISGWCLILGLVCSGLYVFLQRYFGRKIKEINKDISESKAEITIKVEEGISAVREIVAANAQHWTKNRLLNTYEKYMQQIGREIKIKNKSILCGEALEWFPKVFILIVGVYFTIEGTYTIGLMYLMYQYISKLMVSSNQIFVQVLEVNRRISFLNRLDIFFSSLNEYEGGEECIEKIEKMVFNEVYFNYPNQKIEDTSDSERKSSERYILKGINLEIPIGKMIGIVGESGCGKSTIVQLLARFYRQSRGSIQVNGIDLSHINKESWSHLIAIAFQDAYLFPDTIRNNLVLDREDISDEQILLLCELMQIRDFIEEQPEGLDTKIEERGMNLSGGQRQRFILVRALIRSPQLLILDEATSALDVGTEKKVMHGIYQLRKNKTTIIIAHRLAGIERADKVILLKDGNVDAYGTYEELYCLTNR